MVRDFILPLADSADGHFLAVAAALAMCLVSDSRMNTLRSNPTSGTLSEKNQFSPTEGTFAVPLVERASAASSKKLNWTCR